MKVVFVNALNSSPNAQQNAVKQQQITLNKTLAQQLQSPTPNSTFVNKLIGQQPAKLQLVNQLPSPNFSAATVPNTTINNVSNVAKVTAVATSHHSHRHESNSSSEGGRKGKSSKSLLLGSNKMPGKTKLI
jgi:hypothetical protein